MVLHRYGGRRTQGPDRTQAKTGTAQATRAAEITSVERPALLGAAAREPLGRRPAPVACWESLAGGGAATGWTAVLWKIRASCGDRQARAACTSSLIDARMDHRKSSAGLKGSRGTKKGAPPPGGIGGGVGWVWSWRLPPGRMRPTSLDLTGLRGTEQRPPRGVFGRGYDEGCPGGRALEALVCVGGLFRPTVTPTDEPGSLFHGNSRLLLGLGLFDSHAASSSPG